MMETLVQEAISQARGVSSQQYSAGKPALSETDEELMRIVEGIKTSIKVVGCGGAGCNTIDRLLEMGVEAGEVVAVNTDALHLLHSKAHKKILIGTSITGGVGAGNDPEVGEQCAESDIEKISATLQGADMVFLTCGLGGGTGTGSIPVVAEVAKDLQALVIAIVTLPFTVEGRIRAENSLKGLKKLRKYADTVIVIPNDRLLDIAPNLPLNAAFKVADGLLANSVKGITETVTKSGLVNLDFADIRAIMADGGTAMIGLGASTKDSNLDGRARESVEKALESPLLDTDISNGQGALINVVGSRDMTLAEAEEIVKMVAERISPDAEIIWGAQIDESLDRNIIQTLVMISGVSIPGYEEALEDRVEQKGIDHLEMGLKSI
ncbi:MAG TPA: cell division protein FtsZ [Candidatus Altiarchaeales archaeon]|nr:cell division protein FtsZ [Candidatus Altiarchaeales archaeon]